MISQFHVASASLELFLERHQHILTGFGVVIAILIVFLILKISFLLKTILLSNYQRNQIACATLLIDGREKYIAHIGNLCYETLFGRDFNVDSHDSSGKGIVLLIEVLKGNGVSVQNRLSPPPLAAQLRSKAVALNSSEMVDLLLELNTFISISDDHGCLNMIDRQIIELYEKCKSNVPSIRRPV